VHDWKEFKLDNPDMWPKHTRVALEPAHVDGRGSIQSLANLPMKNASLITSLKGSLRSNHYHKTDWHYMYVLSGQMDYYYRPHGSTAETEKISVMPGEMVFTPPMEDHATIFPVDTVFLVLSRNPRDQEAYEADVERVTVISPDGLIAR
jgi:oxalate decarboxylase/phosphoglucose isomerase-like protein (cupin superfamily)